METSCAPGGAGLHDGRPRPRTGQAGDVMNRDARIYVAGHTGLVGSALVRRLRGRRIREPHLAPERRHSICETRVTSTASSTVSEPEYVFLAAAQVGGILANSERPADFTSRQSPHRGQRHRGGARKRREEAPLPRLVLHLPEARRPSPSRRSTYSPGRSNPPTSRTRSRRSPASSS